MLIRSGFCSGGLRKVQRKQKLCSADLLDPGCRHYIILGSRTHRALPHSPEISVMWARVPDRLDKKMGSQTVPTLLSGLKELTQSYCFEQRLAFLNSGDELAPPLKHSLIFSKTGLKIQQLRLRGDCM